MQNLPYSADMESSAKAPVASPKLILTGGQALRGSVRVGGSKNGADYALAACLLTGDECVLENVPEIDDVRVMAAILTSLGVEVSNEDGGVWRIRANNITRLDAPNELVVNQRASFLVMGPLLGRFGEAACCPPGGDVIGTRPLDVHISGFSELGATISRRGEQYVANATDEGGLRGTRVFLDYPSATGTMNIIFAAVLARGWSTIINAAAEPEIVCVAEMLNAMGAKISGAGGGIIEIEGVASLHGTRHEIIPDRLEAGLFALAAAVTHGQVRLENTAPWHLDALITKMRSAGVGVEVSGDVIEIEAENREFRSLQAQAVPYPGLATDLHPPLAAFMTQCKGVSVIHERVYENRLLYIGELRKMGADVISAGQTAIITGPTRLYGTVTRALDVRAGGALVLAALSAEGTTEIHDVYHLDRAHEDLVGKLRSLGATVDR